MSDIYKKLKNIVKEKYIANDIYIRHAYSRNVEELERMIEEKSEMVA